MGSADNTRYSFQVMMWSPQYACWIVSHAAHGDEQLCHLKIEDADADDTHGAFVAGEAAGSGTGGAMSKASTKRLKISLSDNETFCSGVLSADGSIEGDVKQLVRSEEGFWEPTAVWP